MEIEQFIIQIGFEIELIIAFGNLFVFFVGVYQCVVTAEIALIIKNLFSKASLSKTSSSYSSAASSNAKSRERSCFISGCRQAWKGFQE